MFSFRTIGALTLAALLMVTLPARSSHAEESVAKASMVQSKGQLESSLSGAVARVNGTPITRKEVDRVVKVMLAQSQMRQPVPADVVRQAEADALEQLISAELLYQEASKLELKDLDQRIAETVAQKKGKYTTDAEFEKALKTVDMTPKDLQDFTRKDIVINNFIENRYSPRIAVSDAEARKFYDENAEKFFKKPETATAVSFEQVKDEIIQFIKEEKVQMELTRYITEVRKTAKVEKP